MEPQRAFGPPTGIPARFAREAIWLGPQFAPPPTVAGIVGGRRSHKRKRARPGRDLRTIPAYRFVLQFNFSRPINIDYWKKIKAPKGWRKCPTSRSAQGRYWGVRFYCTNLKHPLTPEELELLHAKLIMCLELQP